MIRRKIGALLYYSFAKHLPPSYSGLKLGQKRPRGILREIDAEILWQAGKH